MESLTLWPFTQGELDGGDSVATLVDAALGDVLTDLHPPAVTRAELLERAGAGGFLPALARNFLIQSVPAWSTNLTARVVRRPKLAVTDTGLAARLLGGRLRNDPELAGRLVETFVVGELRAQAEWSDCRPSLFHFRDRDGAEVDLVLESGDGRVVGVEVKAGATVRAEDLGGLRLLERRLGPDFVAGIVLCTAPVPRHLGGRLWIMPISALWRP